MLDKSKHFRKRHRNNSKTLKTEYNFPKANPELLLKIKYEQLLKNKKTKMKNYILIFILVIILFMFYFSILKPFLYA